MTFQSIEYLIFFPLVFILYWTACSKSKVLQNGLIILASLIFYGWWDWRFLGLLLITALSTFFAGLAIGQTKQQKTRKILLIGVIAINVAVLFFFKYFNFFTHTLTDTLNLLGIIINIPTLKILLPVGISFYTFSALSYSIDVYQRKIQSTNDILAYLAYVMFFPSILSGPINRAEKQLPQYFNIRKFDYNSSISACKSILWGDIKTLSCR